MNLEFSQGRITGEGQDEPGEFRLHGSYDSRSGRCSWLKRYPSWAIEYQGELKGQTIRGRWSEPQDADWSGDFELHARSDSTQVERMLVQVRDEGHSDGEGSFTLDLDRAAALLPTKQLEDPQQYIVRLVAFATASGATEFNVAWVKSGYRLHWNGDALSPKELETLLPALPGRRLSELSLSLSAASELYPTVELYAGSSRLLLDSQGIKLDEVIPSEGTTLVVTRPSLFGWLRRFRGADEIELLTQRCAYAQVKITLPWGDTVRPPRTRSPLLTFGEVPQVEGEVLQHQECDPTLGYGLFELDSRASSATLICQGVSYAIGSKLPRLPGRLVWWHDDVTLDLSRSKPVETPEYEHWRHWVVQEITSALKMLTKLRSDHPALERVSEWVARRDEDSARESYSSALLLDQRAHVNLKAGRYEQALADARQAANLERAYLSTLALCLGVAGKLEEAVSVYEETLKWYPDQGWIHANYAEDLELLGRLEQAMARVDIALDLEPSNSHALALKARLLADQDPEKSLSLARQACLNDHCPASVWETLARLARDREDLETVRQSLHNFLALANPATLLESNLPARLEAARAELSRLESREA